MAKSDTDVMAQRNYNGETLKTITVAELIERLQGEDPDAKVIFSTNYGDYSRTEQALPLRGETEQVMIEKSAYSNSGFAIASEDRDDGQFDREGNDVTEYETYLVIR